MLPQRTLNEPLPASSASTSSAVALNPAYTPPARARAAILDRIIAGTLLILAAPVLLVIAVLVLLLDGRPVFYSGERLGLNKRPFNIFKFRTLVRDAETRVGGDLVSATHRLHTRTGGLLRETRLDELPQLFNVLRGDMTLIGPRPERPAVYEKHCRHITGYDKRFHVKPGLIGYSQLFTPHGAPKRARALLDNYYATQARSWHNDILFLWYAIFLLLKRAALKMVAAKSRVVRQLVRGAPLMDLRASHRRRPPGTELRIRPYASTRSYCIVGAIDDISDMGMAFWSSIDLREVEDGTNLDMVLRIRGAFRNHGGARTKQARLHGYLLRVSHDRRRGLYRHVFLYEPQRSVDHLVVHQYMLRNSIA